MAAADDAVHALDLCSSGHTGKIALRQEARLASPGPPRLSRVPLLWGPLPPCLLPSQHSPYHCNRSTGAGGGRSARMPSTANV